MPSAVQPLVIVLALLAFWAIVMRPARKQQRSMARLQSEIGEGEEVILSSGIFGTVRSVDGTRVRLEIAPGIEVTVARQSVVRRAAELPVRDEPPAPPAEPATGHGSGHEIGQDMRQDLAQGTEQRTEES